MSESSFNKTVTSCSRKQSSFYTSVRIEVAEKSTCIHVNFICSLGASWEAGRVGPGDTWGTCLDPYWL